jgi:hypothetical protein
MGESRGAYRVLVGKPAGKRRLGRPRPIWEDNIKMNLQKMGLEAWTGFNWLRIGTGVRHLYGCNEHSVFIKCGEFLD